MKLSSKNITTTYYVEDGMVPYKVVRTEWSPTPAWRADRGDDWKVFGSQGIHRYEKLCDASKATHKRVVAAVQAMIAEGA
jgi:hypothetical protein